MNKNNLKNSLIIKLVNEVGSGSLNVSFSIIVNGKKSLSSGLLDRPNELNWINLD